MDKYLGKNKGKGAYQGLGYYGKGGQGSAKTDGATYDLADDDENAQEKEGYYPRDDEEDDENFINDLHKHGYPGYAGKTYGARTDAYGKKHNA